MEPTDLIGLPKTAGNRTVYAPPTFLPTDGAGIWILEELNRCERYMLAPCLQLLTARCLNDYKLPEKWLPMAAVNPTNEGYDVNDLDPAILSRFTVIRVVPDHATWLAWAKDNQIHEEVMRYVASDHSIFDHPGSDPRSWCAVSNIVKAAEQNNTPASALRTVIAGKVGIERASAFLASLTNDARPLAVAEVLDTYGRHREQLQGWVRDGRLDLAGYTLMALLKHVQPHEEYQGVFDDKKRWRNLQFFLYDLPGDLHDKARAYFRDRNYEFPKKPRPSKKGADR